MERFIAIDGKMHPFIYGICLPPLVDYRTNSRTP